MVNKRNFLFFSHLISCELMLERPPAFTYDDGVLRADQIPLVKLAAQFGTPLYVYSAPTIVGRYRALDRAFRKMPHTLCYSLKANSSLAIVKLLSGLGCGFDVVSGGELERVRRTASGSVKRVVFSGVGKTEAEIDAALKLGILLFNVESEGELQLLAERAARLKKKTRLALRINPDVHADTHPYISTGLREHKFGVSIAEARALYRRAARERYLDVAGVSVHIGSQILDVSAFAGAMTRVAEVLAELKSDGHRIRYVDAGGGLGIPYHTIPGADFAAHIESYANAVIRPLRKSDVHLLLEPGRVIVGPAGVLLTRVLYTKRNGGKSFIVVDGGMNDLLRPSLYSAYHEIVPVVVTGAAAKVVDVVGPVCETGDFFARDRELPHVGPGDLLAILDAGAYGMSLASNYNSRPRPAEVLVDGKRARLIRRQETLDDMLRSEK